MSFIESNHMIKIKKVLSIHLDRPGGSLTTTPKRFPHSTIPQSRLRRACERKQHGEKPFHPHPFLSLMLGAEKAIRITAGGAGMIYANREPSTPWSAAPVRVNGDSNFCETAFQRYCGCPQRMSSSLSSAYYCLAEAGKLFLALTRRYS